MRSKELFKAYVYEKADAARVKTKKTHAIAWRGAAAFSLLMLVGGVWLYGGIEDTSMAPVAQMEEIERDGAVLENVQAVRLDAQDLAEAMVEDECAETNEIDVDDSVQYGYLCKADETQVFLNTASVSYAYSATVTGASVAYAVAENAVEYKGDLENIDFEKNVALVLDGSDISPASLDGCTIEYAEEMIIITIAVAKSESGSGVTAQTCTLLLDKKRYHGQPIEIILDIQESEEISQ